MKVLLAGIGILAMLCHRQGETKKLPETKMIKAPRTMRGASFSRAFLDRDREKGYNKNNQRPCAEKRDPEADFDRTFIARGQF